MSCELWRMTTGRIAEIDLSHDPAAVESLRALLRSHGAVPHEESPAGQGEGFEITSTPSEE